MYLEQQELFDVKILNYITCSKIPYCWRELFKAELEASDKVVM